MNNKESLIISKRERFHEFFQNFAIVCGSCNIVTNIKIKGGRFYA
jgi:hypothetical protein